MFGSRFATVSLLGLASQPHAKVVSLPANRDDRNTSLLTTGLWIVLMDICTASSCLFRLCVFVLPFVELLTFLTSCSIRLNHGKLQKSVFRSVANLLTANLLYISSFFFPLKCPCINLFPAFNCDERNHWLSTSLLNACVLSGSSVQ